MFLLIPDSHETNGMELQSADLHSSRELGGAPRLWGEDSGVCQITAKIVRYLRNTAAPPRYRFEGNTLGGRLSMVLGRSPPDAGEFSKICKRFLKKIAKCII